MTTARNPYNAFGGLLPFTASSTHGTTISARMKNVAGRQSFSRRIRCPSVSATLRRTLSSDSTGKASVDTR